MAEDVFDKDWMIAAGTIRFSAFGSGHDKFVSLAFWGGRLRICWRHVVNGGVVFIRRFQTLFQYTREEFTAGSELQFYSLGSKTAGTSLRSQ